MEVASVLVLWVVILVGALAFEKRRKARRAAAFQEAADALGLRTDGDRIVGELDGILVTVDEVIRGSGKSKQVYTVWNASLAGNTTMPVELDIVPEHALMKVGKVVGMQDHQLELPGIDEKLMVRCADEAAVKAWAQRSDIARGLQELSELKSFAFRLTDVQLTLERRRTEFDAQEIIAQTQRLARLARCFMGQGIGALTDDGHW